jgi:uncharacterized protein
VKKRLAFFAVVLLTAALTSRAAEVIPPKPDRYFNDYAGVVSPAVADRLNLQLAQFERDTSNQVLVVVYPKMQSDSSIEDYTRRVAQAWGVGQKDRRNGVVLFVFVEDRKMFIQVGYGLEGALPDVTAFDITERHIKPRFRVRDYDGGLTVGVDLIRKAIRGEYKGSGRTNAERSGRSNESGSTAGLLVFLVALVLFFLFVRASRRRGGYRYSGLGGPMITGGWGGGGWSSGSPGGGFGSFSSGGGSFGGGGAGSSW